MAEKTDLGYIITDEQIKKRCLAQAPEAGAEDEGKAKGAGQGREIAFLNLIAVTGANHTGPGRLTRLAENQGDG